MFAERYTFSLSLSLQTFKHRQKKGNFQVYRDICATGVKWCQMWKNHKKPVACHNAVQTQETVDEAVKAVNQLHGQEFGLRRIRARYSTEEHLKPKTEGTEGNLTEV